MINNLDLDKLTNSLQEVTSSLQQYTRYSVESTDELRGLLRNVMSGNVAGAMDNIQGLRQRGQVLGQYAQEALRNPDLLLNSAQGIISVQQQQQQVEVASRVLAMRQEIEAQNQEIQRLQKFQEDYQRGYRPAAQIHQAMQEKWGQYQDYRASTFGSQRAGDFTGAFGRIVQTAGDFFGDGYSSMALSRKAWLASQPLRWAGSAISGASHGLQTSFLEHGLDSQLVNFLQSNLNMSKPEAEAASRQLQHRMSRRISRAKDTASLGKGRSDIDTFSESIQDTIAGLSQSEIGDLSAGELTQLIEGVDSFKRNIQNTTKYLGAMKDLFSSDQLRMMSTSIISMSKSLKESQYLMNAVTNEKSFLMNRGVDAAKFIETIGQGLNISQQMGIGARAGIRTAYDIGTAGDLHNRAYLGMHVSRGDISAGVTGLAAGAYADMHRFSGILGGSGGVNQAAINAFKRGDYAGMVGASAPFDMTEYALRQFDPEGYNRQASDALGSPLEHQYNRVKQLLSIMGSSSEANVLSAITRVAGNDPQQKQALFAYMQSRVGGQRIRDYMRQAGNAPEITLRERFIEGVSQFGKDLSRDASYLWRDIRKAGSVVGADRTLDMAELVFQAPGMIVGGANAMAEEIFHQTSRAVTGTTNFFRRDLPTAFNRSLLNIHTFGDGSTRGADELRRMSSEDVGAIFAGAYTNLSRGDQAEIATAAREELTSAIEGLGIDTDALSAVKQSTFDKEAIQYVGDKVLEEFKKDFNKTIEGKIRKRISVQKWGQYESLPRDSYNNNPAMGYSNTDILATPDHNQERQKSETVQGDRNFESVKSNLFSVDAILKDLRNYVIKHGLRFLMQKFGNKRADMNRFLEKLGSGDAQAGRRVFYDLVTTYITREKLEDIRQLEAVGLNSLISLMKKAGMGNIEGLDIAALEGAVKTVSEMRGGGLAKMLGSVGLSSGNISKLQERLEQGEFSDTESIMSAIEEYGGDAYEMHAQQLLEYSKAYSTAKSMGGVAATVNEVGELVGASGSDIQADADLAASIANLQGRIQGLNTSTASGGNFNDSAKLFAESVQVFGKSAVKIAQMAESGELKTSPENSGGRKFLGIF